ncbi:lipoic acid synthetase [Persephonella hydrogeniphila]|uniref:Lipoyl synthase n=1 Tax=Persephonella hydrogeniphila TaxID=198703 RepID=A0A285MZ16_9AQUI|nr:lipoyl synthase [Persephonella hydrogeniphila]SNZ02432.1 lipoic acid synthetase [Persephonella hydrogeniphila]
MKPKVKSFLTEDVTKMKAMLRMLNLHTVCEEASCPNIGDCFGRKTATFMIMGDRCTRRCTYCDVSHDRPLPLDPSEPYNIAKAVKMLGLQYVVITSVNRDDLPDGGASHFAKTVQTVKEQNPDCSVEVLIPDFLGDIKALEIVVKSNPEVINHNIETVPRLFPVVRHRGDYRRSLNIIKWIKELDSRIISKSGIMVGLGEKKEEVIKVMEDLRSVNCEILTVGQYLRPSKNHHPVIKYYTEDEFKEFEEIGTKMGFKHVFSGILVRSSFHADEVYNHLK